MRPPPRPRPRAAPRAHTAASRPSPSARPAVAPAAQHHSHRSHRHHTSTTSPSGGARHAGPSLRLTAGVATGCTGRPQTTDRAPPLVSRALARGWRSLRHLTCSEPARGCVPAPLSARCLASSARAGWARASGAAPTATCAPRRVPVRSSARRVACLPRAGKGGEHVCDNVHLLDNTCGSDSESV